MPPTRGTLETRSSVSSGTTLDEAFFDLYRRLFSLSTSPLSRTDFWRQISELLLGFTLCHCVEIRVDIGGKYYRFVCLDDPERRFEFQQLPQVDGPSGSSPLYQNGASRWEHLCETVAKGDVDPALPFFSAGGSFWTGDAHEALARLCPLPEADLRGASPDEALYQSVAIIPFAVADSPVALILLKARGKNQFTKQQMEVYETVARTLGVAISERRSHAQLRERIKELTCLYGIAKVAEQRSASLEEVIGQIVELLPPGWQYPEATHARIVVWGKSYETKHHIDGRQKQTARIIASGRPIGHVEVSYADEKPELDEGPFLNEERNLIDAIARQIASIVEQRQATAEKARLQRQLQHADRLATIGQLAAGVAHELNEPLASILGFAQLALKSPGLPEQAAADIEKTIRASLHAREVVKKLMLFSRRMPPKKAPTDLNQLVEDGLYFLGSRCAKKGIDLVRVFSRNLPRMTVDPSQLTQIVVNLVVNAIQAMPNGGRLTVATYTDAGHVTLAVEDTGAGMAHEVLDKAFVPFFTTKDVSEGTGLGLAVVHGIVTAHGGTIKVRSQPGVGSRFEIRLPINVQNDNEEVS